MYLGYEYERELSKLTSRVTLYLQKEMSLYFFSPTKIKDDYVLGFTCGDVPLEKIREFITDLKCIYIHEMKQHCTQEVFLLVAKDKEVVNNLYKKLRQGDISTKICEAFDYFNNPVDDEKVNELREKLNVETPEVTA